MPAAGNMMTFNDVAAPLAAQQSNAAVIQFLFLALIVLAFYFFLVRPQRNRQRQQQQLQNSLRPGARIMTTSGMYGTVVEIDDDGIVLEIAPDVEARFVKQAVMQVLPDDTADDEDENEDEDQYEDDLDDEADEREEVDEDADETAAAEPHDDDGKAETETAGEKSSSKPSA